MAGVAVAGQVGITASPIAAATAALLSLFAMNNFNDIGLGTILMVTFPACLIGVVVASVISMFLGKELKDDEFYQARLKNGEILPPDEISDKPLPPQATWSVLIFLFAIVIIVAAGFFPEMRTLPGQQSALGMAIVIEAVMLAAGAVMTFLCKPDIAKVSKSPVLHAGLVSLCCVFGVAWMSDSFIAANKDVFLLIAGNLAETAPWLFAFILAGMAALLGSQGATTRAIMPLGFALAINPLFLIAMFPAVNCLFVLPTSGPALAAVGMDRSGTTYIGKYVFNHSFQIPGLIMVFVAICAGFGIVSVIG